VSLILEALKKLDREKQAPDRGLVVVGASAWPTARDGRPGVGAAAAIALVLSGIGAAAWHYGGRPSVVVPREMAPREVATREMAAQPAAPGPSAGARAAASVPAPPSSAGFANTPRAAVPARGTLVQPRAQADDEAGEPRAPATGTPEPALAAPARTREGRSAAAYQLQAISAQNGHPVAILNDRLVREGDSFDGVKVLRIGADEVEIEVAGRRRVVKF
jgi:hypothetical protein